MYVHVRVGFGGREEYHVTYVLVYIIQGKTLICGICYDFP